LFGLNTLTVSGCDRHLIASRDRPQPVSHEAHGASRGKSKNWQSPNRVKERFTCTLFRIGGSVP